MAVTKTIKTNSQLDTQLLTTGGTSDGRFIAPTGAEVVELGPVNATIHKVDECISIAHLETLKKLLPRHPQITAYLALAKPETYE